MRCSPSIEIVGPHESSETRRLVEFAIRMRLPYSWLAPEQSAQAAALVEQLDTADIPLVRLPGGTELRRPSNGELAGTGDRPRAGQREEADLVPLPRRHPLH